MGGAQAPRRESLLSVRYGRVELAATAVAAIYAGLAWYLVGELGMTTSEATVRTARLATLWNGYETSLTAYGFDRPPLLTALALPFAAFEGLRTNGLAAALGASVGSGISVVAAVSLARSAGFARWPGILFTVSFALNPLLVFAGVFGLPEAIYTALILVALSQFSLWLERQTVAAVITAGIALGIAFLVRYNVVVVAAVMAWAFWWVARNAREDEDDPETALATIIAFLAPVVFIAGLWTLISWFPRGELFSFVGDAHAVTLLGAEDLDVLRRLEDLRADPLGVLGWVGGWSAVIAPASVIGLLWLAVRAIYDRSREDIAFAAACVALLLPEVAALFTGSGQARVPHLFVAIAPAFAILAYRERALTDGVPPATFETPRRRAQLGWTSALALVSLASAGVIVLMPASDPPAAALETTVRTGVAPAPNSAETLMIASHIVEEAGPGDVVVDVERHAEVILLAKNPRLFRTDADRSEEAILYDPFEFAQFVLARRPLPRQGPGRIEEAYEDLFTGGASSLSLAFESGEYRLYSVTGPALP